MAQVEDARQSSERLLGVVEAAHINADIVQRGAMSSASLVQWACTLHTEVPALHKHQPTITQ